MKNHKLFLTLSLLVVGMTVMLVSCGGDDEENQPIICIMDSMVDMTDDGVAQWPGLTKVSKATFESQIIGHGWYCEESYNVLSHGVFGPSTSRRGMYGVGFVHYYFDRDSVTSFVYNDARGFQNGGLGYVRDAYTYDETDNGVYVGGRRLLQLSLSGLADGRYLYAIEGKGTHSDGSIAYAVSIFRQMSPGELSAIRRNYSVRWR
ncbi:hypothetical protein [Prevotella sp. KH2C16]|uniref:hypothetical protein n=1 Tax=Prevotella sp. KH2C16 TaxID=1855325 RepID=UPI0008DF1F5D|nr:hypothetical protein [Prevotella sp. KH2C16]SFG17855.1 hypothetical protein SAMN05216383_106119 [Prevotella sp. KH2C16]